jgi:hypothetical protein
MSVLSALLHASSPFRKTEEGDGERRTKRTGSVYTGFLIPAGLARWRQPQPRRRRRRRLRRAAPEVALCDEVPAAEPVHLCSDVAAAAVQRCGCCSDAAMWLLQGRPARARAGSSAARALAAPPAKTADAEEVHGRCADEVCKSFLDGRTFWARNAEDRSFHMRICLICLRRCVSDL